MADAVDKQSDVSLKFRDPSTYLTKHHFLQNVVPDENFSNMRGGGPLHKDMIFGEVIANVMGNYRIYADHVFFRSSHFTQLLQNNKKINIFENLIDHVIPL